MEPSLDDLQLMAVQLDGVMLSDALEACQYPGGLLVPLGELCRLVGLGITVDPMAATATGFIIREDRRFRLDVSAKEVRVGSRVLPLETRKLDVQANDIYVDSELLGDWLPLKLTVDRNGMLITIRATEQLPVQAQMERERRGAQVRAYLPLHDPGYPVVKAPYRPTSGPFVDTRVRLSADRGDGVDLQYAVLATGDLLYSTGELYLYSEEGKLAPTVRMTLSRSDPTGHLLGGLQARRVAIGDLDSSALPLITSSNRDPGLLVSRFPLNRPIEFDRHTFRGNAPPGWDVELYRGCSLMAFSRVGEDGRYEFSDVPLLLGLNRFRLVLNGPHGERREEEVLFNVGDTLTPVGEHEYEVSVQNRERGGRRVLVMDQWGWRPNLSIGAALADIELDDRSQHRYATVQARGYRGPVYTEMEVADDLDGGWAAGLKAQWLVGAATMSLEHYQARDFVSEVVSPATGSISSHTAVRLDNLRLGSGGGLLPARLGITHDRQLDGTHNTQAFLGLYATSRNLRIAHATQWWHNDGPMGSSQLTGDMLVSRRRGRQYLEGEVGYYLQPSVQLGSVSLRSQYYLKEDRTLAVALNHTKDSGTSFSAGLSRRRGHSHVEGFAELRSGGEVTVGMNLTGFTERDGRGGGWKSDTCASASQGAVSARVFVDHNGNGTYDKEDTPLPGIGFYVDDSSHPAVTDAHGIAFVGGLPAYQPTNVSVARGTLEDPLWIPQVAGVKVMPRPGFAAPVDFPVLQAGEVSGTVFRLRDGESTPAPGVDVELVDGAGKVIQTERSAYDGFFVMTAVPAGEYVLRVAPVQAQRLGLSLAQRVVVVPPDGGFVDGADLTLQPAVPLPQNLAGGQVGPDTP
jgi:hypothetical protein